MQKILSDGIRMGAVAGVATSLAAMVAGKREDNRAIAPLNAVSHILWGDNAARQDRVSFKYTGSGILLNLLAVTSWAFLHRLMFGRAVTHRRYGSALLGGALVSALAYVTDYHVVPKRLTPGFEKRLSNASLFAIYSVLGLALGLSSVVAHSASPAKRVPRKRIAQARRFATNW